MDKYEYRVKTEQMLGLVAQKDYKRAMEIADTIDWRRVKNAEMLCSVSEIYEMSMQLEKSRDILFIAYDRAPENRKIVYRLGLLALKLGDTAEAMDCYEEYLIIAPKDPNQYILRYKILKVEGASLQQQIEALERFKKIEYVERWAYELAVLYHDAGMTSECLEECDDLILWFAEGKHVVQAMELKMKYKALTSGQEAKYNQYLEKSGRLVKEPKKVVKPEYVASIMEPAPIDEVWEQEQNIGATTVISEEGMQAIRDAVEQRLVHEALAPHETVRFDVEAVQKELEKSSPSSEVEELFVEQEQPFEEEPVEVVPPVVVEVPPAVTEGRTRLFGDDPGITGQLRLEEILSGWEEKQKEMEVAIAEEKMRADAQSESEAIARAQEKMLKEEEEKALERAGEKEPTPELPDDIRQLMEDIENGVESKFVVSEEEQRLRDAVPVENKAEIVESLVSLDEEGYDDLSTQVGEETEHEVEYEDEADEYEVEYEDEEDEYEVEYEDEEDEYEEEYEDEADEYEVEYEDEEDEYEVEYEDEYEDEYEVEYEDEYEDEYEVEYEDEYEEADEYAAEYEDEYEEADEYAAEYEDEYEEDEYEVEYEAEDEYEADEYAAEYEDEYEEDEYEVEYEAEDEYEVYDSSEDERIRFEQDEIEDDEEVMQVLEEEKAPSRIELAKAVATGKTAKLPTAEIARAVAAGEKMGQDTGFIVQARYDLDTQSEVGLRAGLTEEQKKLFSYFVPVRGMSEQLVDVLERDKHCTSRGGSSKTGNLLIIGRKGSGKTVLAVDVVKAIQKNRKINQGKVAIVTGEALNKKKISDIIGKLYGGALIIEKANGMNEKTVIRLNKAMGRETGELLVVLEDERKPLDNLLASNMEFRRKFTSRLEVPIFINDELVTFGQAYAKENEYKIDEMGILALYSRIDALQREDNPVTVAEVKDIIDGAIEHSKKVGVKMLAKKIFGKSDDVDGRVILTEKNFNH